MISRRSSQNSALADTAEQYIKLECVRRKNQLTLRRRASMSQQYVLRAARTKIHEKHAQVRHHEYLLRAENRVAIDAILDAVRDLAEMDANVLGHTLSPMEKHRFHTWTADVSKILYEFEASDEHHRDPIVQVLEKLEFLQEGHVCLAEIAVDARQLLERWEREGVFDAFEGGNSDDEGEEIGEQVLQSPKKQRRVEDSYGYQTIRERAAAQMIKRNVLLWARSRETFCARVAELEAFGNTTQGFLHELSLLSAHKSNTGGADIFDIMKGRREQWQGQSMNFKELLRFSKHIALFTVDHALRRVEELETKRRLFELRCIFKLQTWWRRFREEVRGRRMLQLLADVKRQRVEAEARAAKERKLAQQQQKARMASEVAASKRKSVNKPSSRNGRNTVISPPSSSSSASSSRAILREESESEITDSQSSLGGQSPDTKAVEQIEMQEGPTSTVHSDANHDGHANSPSTSEQAIDTGITSTQAQEHPSALVAERLPVHSEIADTSGEDSDTKDVEDAWQRFLDTAVVARIADDHQQTRDTEIDHITQETSAIDALKALDPPESDREKRDEAWQALAGDGGWSNWSDDEAPDVHLDEDITQHQEVSDPESDGVSKQANVPANGAGPASSNLPPRRNAVLSLRDAVEALRSLMPTEEPISSSLFRDTASTLMRRRLPLPGAGRLSVTMPFGEAVASASRSSIRGASPSSPSSPPRSVTRRHLYEMEFTSNKNDIAFDRFAPSLVDDSEPESFSVPSLATTTELVLDHSIAPRPVSPVRLFAALRARRITKLKTGLRKQQAPGSEPTNPEAATMPVEKELVVDATVTPEIHAPEIEEVEAPVTYRSETPQAPKEELVLNQAPITRAIRGRQSVIEAFMAQPILRLNFHKEDVMRAAVAPTDIMAETSKIIIASERAESPKHRFSSHSEWLQSMGLDNVTSMASRCFHARQRRLKVATPSREAIAVGVSIPPELQQQAERARKKRMEQHSLSKLRRKRQGAVKIEDTSRSEKEMLRDEQRSADPEEPMRKLKGTELPRLIKRGQTPQGQPVRENRHQVRDQPIAIEDYTTRSTQDGHIRVFKAPSSDEKPHQGEPAVRTKIHPRSSQPPEVDTDDGGSTCSESPTNDDKEPSSAAREEHTKTGGGVFSGMSRRRPTQRPVHPRRSTQERTQRTTDEPNDPPQQKRPRRRQLQQQQDETKNAATASSPTETPSSTRSVHWQYRRPLPTLLQCLVPKRPQHDDSSHPTSQYEESFLDEDVHAASDDDDADVEPECDPHAFQELLNQYLGLLQSQPLQPVLNR